MRLGKSSYKSLALNCLEEIDMDIHLILFVEIEAEKFVEILHQWR